MGEQGFTVGPGSEISRAWSWKRDHLRDLPLGPFRPKDLFHGCYGKEPASWGKRGQPGTWSNVVKNRLSLEGKGADVSAAGPFLGPKASFCASKKSFLPSKTSFLRCKPSFISSKPHFKGSKTHFKGPKPHF